MSDVEKQLWRLFDLNDNDDGVELVEMERYRTSVLLRLEISGGEDEATATRFAAIADALESTSRARR